MLPGGIIEFADQVDNRTPARWEVQYRDPQDRICEITVTATNPSSAFAAARHRLGDQMVRVEGAWRVTS